MRRLTDAALAAIVLLSTAGPGLGQDPPRDPGSQPAATASASRPLEVPFVPQSELLCGGAAVAMVERFWGRREAHAEAFAPLVRRDRRGITTTDLTAAVRQRGWRALVTDRTPDQVRSLLHRRLPVIALMEVAADRYHYIVLLDWTDERVTYHDPAVGPSREMPTDRFLARWAGAGNWTLVILPDDGEPAPTTPPPSDSAATPDRQPACPPWGAWAVEAARADQLTSAARFLEHARSVCPDDDVLVREHGGILFRQERFADAARVGLEYARRQPEDPYAWRLVAASRFLAGDRSGALAAWNHVRIPSVDLVRIDGLVRTRYRPVADALALPPGTILTPARLELARRRIADLPAAGGSSLGYQPLPEDRVEVRAAISERPLLLDGWRQVGRGALRALVREEVRLDAASPTGGGELLSGGWRWDPARPRVGLRVEVPARLGPPGVLRVESGWERSRISAGPTGSEVVEERRLGAAQYSAWITSRIRPSLGLRIERWMDRGTVVTPTVGGEVRLAGDRIGLGFRASHSIAPGEASGFSALAARGLWQSGTAAARTLWSARLGVDLATSTTPFAMLPLVGTDPEEVIPLRAHRLVEDGLIAGRNVGRRIVHGGLAADRTVWSSRVLTLALGSFTDAAGIFASPGPERNDFHLDAGGGIRLGIGRSRAPTLRVDLARGLLDGGTVLSVGVHSTWPVLLPTAFSPAGGR